MFKFLGGFGLKRSENEINNFMDLFVSGDAEQTGMVVGCAALMNHSFSSVDPEFGKLVNSALGENQRPISLYILQLNKLQNQYHKAGQVQYAAGIRLWNITFRCMSNNAFHQYGNKVWGAASEHLEEARRYLTDMLESAETSGNTNMVEKINGALGLIDYIPPQFRSS